MELDGGDSSRLTKALQDLQALAHNTNNIYRDMALYYLSSFYTATGQEEEARRTMKKMREIELNVDTAALSPWVSQQGIAL
jgi:hypothetical protein